MSAEMGSTYLARVMQTVPAYTEVELELDSGRTVKGMARDMPTQLDSQRRWTIDGNEWFIDGESLLRVGVRRAKITMPENLVWIIPSCSSLL